MDILNFETGGGCVNQMSSRMVSYDALHKALLNHRGSLMRK